MNKFLIILSLGFLLFLTACHRGDDHGHDHGSAGDHTHASSAEHGEEHGEEHVNANTATLTQEQVKSIQIEFGTIEKKQLTAALRANGKLKVPNQNKANATAIMGGVIRSILVQTGTTVKKGQPIATVVNPAFINLQEEYMTITVKADLAKVDYDRQKELQQGNASSLKNLQAAEAELRMLLARKASLEKQLELAGLKPESISPENIQSVVTITSPIGGAISDVMVNIGSHVDTNTPILKIVDNSQLHVDLFVYEKDLGKLKVGQKIHFTLTNNPGKEYDAVIFGISNTFEEETKAIAVHAKVEGNKVGLIDGMSITALVSLEEALLDAVPTSAIVNHDGNDFIFILTDEHAEVEHHEESGEQVHKYDEDGHTHDEHGHPHGEEETKTGMTFEKIPVRKGTTDVGYSEITLLKEIPAKSKIVVNGAFFILAKMTNQGEAHSH